MNFVCLLLPSLLFCYVSNKLNKRACDGALKSLAFYLAEYLTGVVLVNFLTISALLTVRFTGVVVERLNASLRLSVSYLIVASALSLLTPIVIKKVKSWLWEGDSSKTLETFKTDSPVITAFVVIFTVIMGLLHFIRCFDNNFWSDEGFTIMAAREELAETLRLVVLWGHSPLQYIVESVFWHTFGESGFLFHFASILPYFFILAASVTIVRKWFGNIASILLTTFSTLLECAIVYNLEVRMYAWCQFFILMAYLMSYGVYMTNKRGYYILMCVFSIGAVFSHYFCLASIGLTHLFLFLYKFINRKYIDVLKVTMSGGLTLVFLSFWMLFAKLSVGYVFINSSIWIVTWRSCFEFIFHSESSFFLLYSFVVTTILEFCFDLIQARRLKNAAGRRLSFQESESAKLLLNKWIWELSGIFAVLGTIIFAQVFSSLVAPITHLRYLYVSFVIIWLLFSINVANLKFGKPIGLCLTAFVILIGLPPYYATTTREIADNRRLSRSASATQEIDDDDFIYTNFKDILWSVSRIYYPKTQYAFFETPTQHTFSGISKNERSETPNWDDNYQEWLFLSGVITEDIQQSLRNDGKKACLINDGIVLMDKGLWGTEPYFIYKIHKIDANGSDRQTEDNLDKGR